MREHKKQEGGGSGEGGASESAGGQDPRRMAMMKRHRERRQQKAEQQVENDAEAEVQKEVEQENHDAQFLHHFAYYAEGTEMKDLDPIGDAKLDAALAGVRAAAKETEDPQKSVESLQKWDSVRPIVEEVLQRAGGEGVDPEAITAAKKALHRMDETTAHKGAEELIDEQGKKDTFIDPEVGVIGPTVKALDQSIGQVYDLSQMVNSVAQDLSEEKDSKQLQSAASAFALFYGLWSGTQDVSEKLDQIRNSGAGGLTKLSTALEVIQHVASVVNNFIVAASSLGQLLAPSTKQVTGAFAEIIERAQKSEVEKLSDGLSYGISVLEMTVGAIDLFKAIRAHDTAGEITAAGEIAGGGVSLALLADSQAEAID
jgi:hypothetical protein